MNQNLRFVFLAGLMLASCNPATERGPLPNVKNDSAPDSGFHDWPTLRSKLDNVVVGTSTNDVVALLGPPTSELAMQRKEGPRIVGYLLFYVVAANDIGHLNDTHDKYVELTFDIERRLTDLRYVNLP